MIDNIKSMLDIFSFSDILMLLLSVFVPTIISIESEKAKNHRYNMLGILRSLDVLILDIKNNNDRIRSIQGIVKEYREVPTKHFGRNLIKQNRKKEYWTNIIINDLNNIKIINTSTLNNFLHIKQDGDVIFKVNEYNKCVSDFKSMISLYNINKRYLSNNDLFNIVTLIDKISEKNEIVLNSISKLGDLAVSESESLLEMYKKPVRFSKAILVIVLILLVIHIGGGIVWDFRILDMEIFKNIYWGLVCSSVLFGLTSSKIILKE